MDVGVTFRQDDIRANLLRLLQLRQAMAMEFLEKAPRTSPPGHRSTAKILIRALDLDPLAPFLEIGDQERILFMNPRILAPALLRIGPRTLFFNPLRFCLDYPSQLDYKERFNLCK